MVLLGCMQDQTNNKSSKEMATVPVKKDTRERIVEIKEKHDTSYDKLLNSILDRVNEEELSPPKSEVNGVLGMAKKERKTEHVRNLLTEHGEAESLTNKAIEVLEIAYDDGKLLNKHTSSLAAGSIYAARLLENEGWTQEEVAEEYGVGKATVRNTYQPMIESYLD